MKTIEEWKDYWDNFNQELYIDYLIKKQEHENNEEI